MSSCPGGLFRLGSIIKFIPYPVTTGFTAGIALIIFSQQMGDFFGLSVTNAPPEFFSKWAVYLDDMENLSPMTLGVAAATLAVMLLIRRFVPRVPGRPLRGQSSAHSWSGSSTCRWIPSRQIWSHTFFPAVLSLAGSQH